MTDVDFALCMLALLALANYRTNRSVLYPPFIFCMMWLMALSIYAMGLIDVDAIHTETLGIITGGALLFSFGGWMSFLIPSQIIRLRFVRQRIRVRSLLVKRLFLLFIIVNMVIFLQHIIGLAASAAGNTFLSRARNALVEAALVNPQNVSWSMRYINLISPLSIFTTVLFLIESKDRYFWIAATVALITSILTTGRTDILLLLTSVATVSLMKSRKRTFLASVRLVKWPVLMFTGLFCLLILTNKEEPGNSQGTGEIIQFSIISYVIGPTAALDRVVDKPEAYAEASNHTFKFFFTAASLLHLINYTLPPPLDTFIYVPFPTNVYTVYKFYIVDFGPYGALFAMMVIGFLHCMLYRKAQTGNDFGIFIFALTVYSVIMVIFDDHYFDIFTRLLYASFFYFAYMILRTYHLCIFHSKKRCIA